MLCAISGEAPSVPVVSAKSGNIFEKRLIEAYIAEHGKDPVTGEELTSSDLIALKTTRVVRPRPPTLTSVPALLSTLQDEWDAMAMETHTARQQLVQLRQELSTALYQHDAATRVIARLLKERDEARNALNTLSVVTGPTRGTEDMEVGEKELPAYMKDKVEESLKALSASRRKRVIPEGWADSDAVSSFETVFKSEVLFAGTRSLDTNPTGELALIGGSDGLAGVYSIPQRKLLASLKADDGAIVDVVWAGTRPVTATVNGVLRIWNENGSDSTSTSAHSGGLKALASHPRGDILGSVGEDKSWAIYDLETTKAVVQVYGESELNSADFHPDGHLFAAGNSSAIQIFDIRSTALGARFDLHGPASSLNFSENGFWLALSVEGESTVQIWDLRKMAHIKSLEIGTRVDSVRWDYTGQFLAAAGPSGISVQSYSKPTKSWSEPLRSAVPAVATAWGSGANSLVSVNREGMLTVLGVKG